MSAVSGVSVMGVVGARGARGVRWCGVLCLAVALGSGLSGCRPRAVANQNAPAVPPSAVATDSAPSSAAGSAPGSGRGSVGQQDVDSLNGILASVGGAVTSVRSAIGADSPTAGG